jgi:hypothetical protein
MQIKPLEMSGGFFIDECGLCDALFHNAQLTIKHFPQKSDEVNAHVCFGYPEWAIPISKTPALLFSRLGYHAGHLDNLCSEYLFRFYIRVIRGHR